MNHPWRHKHSSPTQSGSPAGPSFHHSATRGHPTDDGMHASDEAASHFYPSGNALPTLKLTEHTHTHTPPRHVWQRLPLDHNNSFSFIPHVLAEERAGMMRHRRMREKLRREGYTMWRHGNWKLAVMYMWIRRSGRWAAGGSRSPHGRHQKLKSLWEPTSKEWS